MKRAVVLMLALSLQGCGRARMPDPRGYSHWQDWVKGQSVLTATVLGDPCTTRVRAKSGADSLVRSAMDECYRLGPPHRMRGLWLSQLEASTFCPGRRVVAQPLEWCGPSYMYLAWAKGAKPLGPDRGQYLVDFVGRRTTFKIGSSPDGQPGVVVDRLISIREIALEPATVTGDRT